MLRRLANFLRGILGLFVSGLERQNPEALLEAEKEHLREQIGRYNQGLSSHAALCERLISQVKKLENDSRDLRARTTAHLRAGNREAAGQYALQLETVEHELTENRRQLEQAETTYRELLKARDISIRAAQTKIDSLKSSLNDLKIKRVTAELAQMASGMVMNIGDSGDTLDRLTKMVNEERELAAGRARVARDSLDASGIHLKANEQLALADQALTDFAAKEGLALPPSPEHLQIADSPETPGAGAGTQGATGGKAKAE